MQQQQHQQPVWWHRAALSTCQARRSLACDDGDSTTPLQHTHGRTPTINGHQPVALFCSTAVSHQILVSHFNFLFIPCGRLSWLPISLLLHIKYTLSYRIVTITISLTLLTLTLKICNMWACIHVSLLITTVCVCITAVISGVSIVCVL